MRLLSTVFTLCTVFPMVANAQASAEPAAAPAAVPVAPPPAVEPAAAVAAPAPAPAPAVPPPIAFGWEALVDAYYLYNFTGDPKTQPPAGRQFDTTANNFALNYAKLGVHADTDLVSFRMDFGAGHTAAIINASSAGTSGPTAPGEAPMYASGFVFQQAFATVKPTSYLTIDAGKFVTSASAEVIEANKNWLYSRSLLFFGVPLLHTGLRINGTVNPALTLSLQLVNGWNNDPDINSDKTVGFNATYAPPNQGLTASFTTYIGKETGSNTRILLDGVFLKDIGNLSVGANLDYYKQDTAWWFGLAAMGRYILSDAFNVAARAEYLMSKKDGYIAPDPTAASDANVYEITGQGAWTVGKHYELRLEIRADMSDKEIFLKGTTPKKNQVTGLLAALAYF
jgi:hypothetical protein